MSTDGFEIPKHYDQERLNAFQAYQGAEGYTLSDSAWQTLLEIAWVDASRDDRDAFTLARERFEGLIKKAELATQHPITGDPLAHAQQSHADWLHAKEANGVELPGNLLTRVNPFYTELLVDGYGTSGHILEVELIETFITKPEELSFPDLLSGTINGRNYPTYMDGINAVVKRWWRALEADSLVDSQIVNLLCGNEALAPLGTLRLGDVAMELFNRDSQIEGELRDLLANKPGDDATEEEKLLFLSRLHELNGRRQELSTLTGKLPKDT